MVKRKLQYLMQRASELNAHITEESMRKIHRMSGIVRETMIKIRIEEKKNHMVKFLLSFFFFIFLDAFQDCKILQWQIVFHK